MTKTVVDKDNMTERNEQLVKAFLPAVLLYLSVSAQPQTITGKVVGVSDGRNRVPFANEAEAQAARYRKAKNCSQ